MKYIIGMAIGILFATGVFYWTSVAYVKMGAVKTVDCGLQPGEACEYTFEGYPGVRLVDYYAAIDNGALEVMKRETKPSLRVTQGYGGLQLNTVDPQKAGRNW